MSLLRPFQVSVDGISLGRFLLRVVWLAIQLILVLWLGQKGTLFFYQGF
jgi:hypothetical protein